MDDQTNPAPTSATENEAAVARAYSEAQGLLALIITEDHAGADALLAGAFEEGLDHTGRLVGALAGTVVRLVPQLATPGGVMALRVEAARLAALAETRA